MLKYYLLILPLIFCFINIYGQEKNMQISGTTIDQDLDKGVANTKVFLVRVKDSVITDIQNTDREGNFEFQIPLDTVRLIINHPKYDEKEYLIVGTNDNTTFALGEIPLPEKGKGLDEVIIMAYKEPIYFKGDTLVYVADSFKTRPNAVVEDLLKKLPGVKVGKSGNITVQGKEVKRVLVDGDEFFGSDATLATRNLQASSISTVEVYEKKEEGALDSDEKIQVLDLKMKDDAKKGYFGEVHLGSDFTRFHEAKLLGNYFTSKQKISVYALGANTLESSLSWSQMNKFGLNHLNAYQYDSETDSWSQNDNYLSSTSGLPQLMRTGAYYQGKVNDKLTIGGNYTYSEFKLSTSTSSNSTYNLTDTSFSQNTTQLNNEYVKQHEANLNVIFKLDSTQTISFSPKFVAIDKQTELNSTVEYRNSLGASTRNGERVNDNTRNGFNFKTPFSYTKLYRKNGRKLYLLNNFVYDQGKNNGALRYSDQFPNQNAPFFDVNQLKTGSSQITSNLLQVVFTEPLTKTLSLQSKGESFLTSNIDNLYSYNYENGSYSQLDSLTTNEFKSNKNKSSLSLTLLYNKKKHRFNAEIAGSYIQSNNQNLFTNNSILQKNFFLLPSVAYTFKQSKSATFMASARTFATLPTNAMLQPVNNNLNPNSVYLGAPDLMPSYNISGRGSYNLYKSTNNLYIYGYAQANYALNSFSPDIQFDNEGRQLLTYFNKDLFQSAHTGFSSSLPLIKQIIFVSPGFSYGINNQIGRVNSIENFTTRHQLEPEMGIYIDLDFMNINYEVGYDHSLRKNKTAFDDHFFNTTWKHELEMEAYLPWKMDLGFSLEYTKYRNLANTFNANPCILSARITQHFGENRQWSVIAQVHDILNQNQQISRYNGLNNIVDSRVNTIARYFQLKLSYKFNSAYKKSKKTDEDNLDTND